MGHGKLLSRSLLVDGAGVSKVLTWGLGGALAAPGAESGSQLWQAFSHQCMRTCVPSGRDVSTLSSSPKASAALGR